MLTIVKQKEEPTCNRCGRCCHYNVDGKWFKCKYLSVHGRTTSCRIWRDPTRLGRSIGPGVVCGRMGDLHFTYVGCPYNPGAPVVKVPVRPYFD